MKFNNLTRALSVFVLSVVMLGWALTGCKNPRLEPGGVYSPTNSVGVVVSNDIGLALTDASYKFAYESIKIVFDFERDNRSALWTLTPEVKKSLDKVRPVVSDINRRWAKARQLYRQNPTPAGLSDIQTILAEIQRILPVIQNQTAPVFKQLTKPTQ